MVYPAPTRERKQSDASEGSDVGDPVRVAEDKSKVRRGCKRRAKASNTGIEASLMPKHPNSSVNNGERFEVGRDSEFLEKIRAETPAP